MGGEAVAPKSAEKSAARQGPGHARAWLPGFKAAGTVEASRSSLRGKTEPAYSGLLSNRWDTPFGQFGVLVDVAHSQIATRSNGLSVGHYFSRTNAVTGDTSGTERWIPASGIS